MAYTTANGAFRQERVLPAEKLVKLPDDVSDEVAAASMLKGMTVEYLLNRSFKVQKSHTVLFHAAAGGVGLIAVNGSSTLGRRVSEPLEVMIRSILPKKPATLT